MLYNYHELWSITGYRAQALRFQGRRFQLWYSTLGATNWTGNDVIGMLVINDFPVRRQNRK